MTIQLFNCQIIAASIAGAGGSLSKGRALFTVINSDIIPGNNGGIIVPAQIEVILSASGLGTAALFANSQGTTGSQYKVELFDYAGRKVGEWRATMPASNCYLHDILGALPVPTVDAATAAVTAAQSWAAQASAKADAAAASAAQADADVTAAAGSATAAAGSATAAAGSATAANTSAGAAASSANDSSNSAALSLQWATSLVAVSGGLFGSKYYANAASTSAASAAQSATDAGNSATTAGQMRDQSVAARDTSQTNAGTASGSATLAQSWATSLAVVSGGFYGARKYSIDAGNSASAAANWAQLLGATPSGTDGDWSAKAWAQANLAGNAYGGSAKDWAQSASKPDGVNESSKTYAGQAAGSAQSAATAATSANQASAVATQQAVAAGNASSLALAVYGTSAGLNAAQQIMLGYAATAMAQAALAASSASSAASVAQQDLSGVSMQALHRSPNAVTALFVYDTSKDSDGGAWIDRVGDKSWQNEALNGAWLTAGHQLGFQNELEARGIGATTGAEINPDVNFGTPAQWNAAAGTSVAGGKANFTAAANASAITRGDIGNINGAYLVTLTIDSISQGAVGVSLGINTSSFNAALPGTYTFVVASAGSGALIGLRAVGATTAVVSKFSVKAVTAFNLSTGSYYPDATTGKFFKLSKNLLRYSTWAGTVGAASTPTGWAATGSQGNNPLTLAQESVNGTVTGVVKIRRIHATAGYEGLQYNTALWATAFGARILVRVPTGVVATDLVTYDGNGSVTIATAATLNAQPKDTWVAYTVTHTPTVLRSQMAFAAVPDGTAGHGFDLAMPSLEVGAVTGYEATDSQETNRGNKARFPRMPAIVVESGQRAVMYDLSEPGRPMWMVFRCDLSQLIIRSGTVVTVSALNGELVFGSTGGAGDIHRINFIKDSGRTETGGVGVMAFNGNIAQRNSQLGHTAMTPTNSLVGRSINSVAMYAMPGAPIDAVTGLPVPTIAVGTTVGVTVLKDDGTAVNDTTNSGQGAIWVGFSSDGRLMRGWNNDNRRIGIYKSGKVPAANDAGALSVNWNMYGDSAVAPNALTTASAGSGAFQAGLVRGGMRSQFASGGTFGLWQFVDNMSTPGAGLANQITSTYNTGWMVGDIRRAWGIDTIAGTVNGAERVTNGAFGADVSGWTANGAPGAQDTTFAWSATNGGCMIVTRGTGATTGYPYQQITGLTAGKRYRVSVGILAGTASVRIGSALPNGDLTSNDTQGVGTFISAFTAPANGTVYVQTWPNGFSSSITVDNVSVQEAVEDRSVKAKHPIVYGTLALTPVATAAQVVALSGFSATNYLQEANSADLDYGTAAWQAAGWMNVPAAMPVGSFPELTAELVTNGNFASGATGWTLSGGWAVAGGAASDNAGGGSITQAIGTIGKVYKITFTSGTTAPINGQFGTTFSTITPIVGTNVVFGQCAGSGNIGLQGGGVYSGITNISVKEVGIAPIIHRGAAAGAYWQLGILGNGMLAAEAYDGTTTRRVTSTAAYNTGVWVKPRVEYDGAGNLTLKVNGEQVAQATGAALLTLNNAAAVLTTGNNFALTAAFPGNLALVKTGATLPSADASRWMYAQEVQMFGAGAQVALADTGSVLSVAYDDALDRVKVATAANESSFRGLVRVDNAAAPAGSYLMAALRSGVKLTARSTTNPGVDVSYASQNLKEELLKRAQDAANQAKLMEPFDFDATASQTDFILGLGWTAKEVYAQQLLQREGSSKNFTRLYDGFRETIRFNTGRSLNDWVQLKARRAA